MSDEHKEFSELTKFLLKKGLTHRETEIVALVNEGHTSPEIGKIAFLCEKTVKFHLTNIYRKLGFTEGRRGKLLRLCMTYLLQDEMAKELCEERSKSEALKKENQVLRDKMISTLLPRGNQ